MTKTPEKREQKNLAAFVAITVISGIAANILSEGYIQAYLIKLGFGTQAIRNYGATIQTVSIFAYIISSRLPPMKRGLKKIYAATILLACIFPLALAAAGFVPQFAAVYMATLAAASYSFLGSFRAVAEFSMMPHLFSRSLYGSAVSRAMAIGGLATVCISVFAGFLSRHDDGPGTYILLFGVSVAMLLASAVLVRSYKFEEGGAESPPERAPYRDLIRKIASAKYSRALSPHFLRGVAIAGIYYIVPSALGNIGLSDSEKSYFIVVSVVSTMVGSFLFMRLCKKIKSGAATFVSTLVCAALMPLLAVCENKYFFFALYFVFLTFSVVSSISIPTGVLRSTPDDELLLITSMRFVSMSLSSALFIFIFGIMLQCIAPVYIMLFSGAVFVLCGLLCKRLFDDRL
ncbi:MAG: MFS transporter [Oscillospiraceae bacterium]|nr:MFS transporter [Oscillospiraceae bacterium]